MLCPFWCLTSGGTVTVEGMWFEHENMTCYEFLRLICNQSSFFFWHVSTNRVVCPSFFKNSSRIYDGMMWWRQEGNAVKIKETRNAKTFVEIVFKWLFKWWWMQTRLWRSRSDSFRSRCVDAFLNLCSCTIQRNRCGNYVVRGESVGSQGD